MERAPLPIDFTRRLHRPARGPRPSRWLVVVIVVGGVTLSGGVGIALAKGWLISTLFGPTPVSSADLVAAEARLMASGAVKVTVPLKSPRIIIKKGLRLLELFEGDELVKTYSVSLGRSPEGDKEIQGDKRTPEGSYHLVTRNDQSKFHLFLGLNYPNGDDADAGLADGLITQAEHATITKAAAVGKRPPWGTALGGAVGIHGGGGFPFDWTAGCIALDDEDMDELWVATRHWTPVTILP